MTHSDKKIDIITNKIGLSMEIAQWCINLNNKYSIWIANQIKKTPSLFPAKCGEFENIIDWKKDHPNINLNEINFKTALKKTKEYLAKKHPFKEGNNSLKNDKVVLDLGEYKWVQIKTMQDAKEEGEAMSHCIGTHYGNRIVQGQTLAFSLRDEFNLPHVTIEITEEQIGQYKGKGNSEPKGKYLEHFFKLIANYKVKKIHDQYFWNSIKNNPEYLEIMDEVHSHLISFKERIKQGLKPSNKNIYQEEVIDIIQLNDGQLFSLPDRFKILGCFNITVSPKAKIHVGNNSIFSDDLLITNDNITIGDNVRIGGSLFISGGLNNNPKNLRVCGDVKIFLKEEKHTKNDLYNALEGIYSGGYLDIEIIKKENAIIG